MIGHELILPFGPSVNAYWLRNRNGGVRVSDKAQDYRWEVLKAVKQSKMPKLTGRLFLVLRVFPPDRRVRDLDNFLKAALDALMHAGAFVDDGQIDDLSVKRGPIVSGGRFEVLVGEIA